MGVGLGLFATGILALCCGVSSINNEPMKMADNKTYVNNGTWYDFHTDSTLLNTFSYNNFDYVFDDTEQFQIDFLKFDDTGISWVGGFGLGYYVDTGNTHNVSAMFCSLPNNVGGSEKRLVSVIESTDYSYFECIKHLQLFSNANDDSGVLFSQTPMFLRDGLDSFGTDNAIDSNAVTYIDTFDGILLDANACFVYFTYDGLFEINYLYLNTVTDRDTFYRYEISFIDSQSTNVVPFWLFYGQMSVYADWCNDYFYTFDLEQHVYYPSKNTFNFSTEDEGIPYDDDYTDLGYSDIGYQYRYIFNEYRTYGTFIVTDFSHYTNNYRCYIVRSNITADYSRGYNSGYQVGYSDGQRIGYENGYRNGVNDTYATDNSFFHLFGAIADTPILMLRSLFDFDLFGINVLVAVLSLLTAIITAWVIRKFI